MSTILLTVVVLALLCVSGASASQAGGASATIASPSNPTSALTAGGSQTSWTVALPAQASCSGDTAHKAYHIFGYIVPSSVNPGGLMFNTNGPSQGFPLVDSTGSPYIEANTAEHTGQIVQIPKYNWALFSSDGRNGTQALAPGTYNVGIACANTLGQGDRYWNTQVSFRSEGGDRNGLIWTAQGAIPTQAHRSQSSFPLGVAISIVAAILVLGTGLLVLRRRRSSQMPQPV
jgi:hypothetical protein